MKTTKILPDASPPKFSNVCHNYPCRNIRFSIKFVQTDGMHYAIKNHRAIKSVGCRRQFYGAWSGVVTTTSLIRKINKFYVVSLGRANASAGVEPRRSGADCVAGGLKRHRHVRARHRRYQGLCCASPSSDGSDNK